MEKATGSVKDRLEAVSETANSHAASVNDIIYISDADAFITASEDRTLGLWLEIDGSWVRTQELHIELKPCALAWDGCRQWICVGLEDGTLLVLTMAPDFSDFCEYKSFPVHTDVITGMRYDPVLDSIVTVSRDRQLCVWDPELDDENNGIRGKQVSNSWISTLELYHPYPNVTLALCATYESNIVLVDCRWKEPREVHRLYQHGGSVRCLYLETRGNYLFSSGFDTHINIWELKQNKVTLRHRLVGHRKKVNGVAYHAGRKRVLSAGDDGDIHIWDPATPKPTFTLQSPHNGAVEHLHWEEDKKLLISTGQDRVLRVWRFSGDSRSQSMAESLTASAELWKRGISESAGITEECAEISQVRDDTKVDAAILSKSSDPKLAGYKRTINSFIKAFLATNRFSIDKADTASRFVQDFLQSLDDSLHSSQEWSECSEDNIAAALEVMEAYLMSRVYFRVFGTSAPDQEQDAALHKRLSQLSFIQPEHLEIPVEVCLETAAFQEAKEALCEIANCKVPQHKVTCVVSCCRAIHKVITDSKEAKLRKKYTALGSLAEHDLQADASEAAASAGADEFLPIFIYVVLQSNPKQLYSSIQYVQRFRYYLRMGSEGGCFFTHLSSAVYFLEHLTADSLSIDPETYEYYVNGCKATGLRVSAPPQESQQLWLEGQDGAEVEKSGGGIFLPSRDSELDSEALEEDGHVGSPASSWMKRSSAGSSGLFSDEVRQEEEVASSAAPWMALLNTMDNELESDNLFAGLQDFDVPTTPESKSSADHQGNGGDRLFEGSTGELNDPEVAALLREVQEDLDTPLFPEELAHEAELSLSANEKQSCPSETSSLVGIPLHPDGSSEMQPESSQSTVDAALSESPTSDFVVDSSLNDCGFNQTEELPTAEAMSPEVLAANMSYTQPEESHSPPSVSKLGDLKSFFETKIALAENERQRRGRTPNPNSLGP